MGMHNDGSMKKDKFITQSKLSVTLRFLTCLIGNYFGGKWELNEVCQANGRETVYESYTESAGKGSGERLGWVARMGEGVRAKDSERNQSRVEAMRVFQIR